MLLTVIFPAPFGPKKPNIFPIPGVANEYSSFLLAALPARGDVMQPQQYS
jgi:hypothetical protein